MHIKIPFHSRSPKHEQLIDVVQRTSQRTGIDPFRVAYVMGIFCEEVAEHVAKGDIVSIPGFGRFGAMVSVRKNSKKPFPGFVGAQPFQKQVRQECPLDERAHKSMIRYRQDNHPSKQRTCAGGREVEAKDKPKFVRNAMYFFVASLRKQAKKLGIDLGGYDD